MHYLLLVKPKKWFTAEHHWTHSGTLEQAKEHCDSFNYRLLQAMPITKDIHDTLTNELGI